jgi:signal transduction histidine kinase
MKPTQDGTATPRTASPAEPRRRSLTLAIVLGVVLILAVLALTVGWVLLSAREALTEPRSAGLYWTVLSVGSALFATVLVGVILYLTLSLKAINLSRRQSNFIDSVTHELKSPITSLKLYLQTLGRRQVSDAERADFHRFMLEDVEQLDALIDHMLDAARLDQRPVDTETEDVELGPVLQKTVGAVCARYKVSPAAVRCDLEPVVVRARHLDVELVFRNLIDNAVKYSGTPTAVEIEVRCGREGRVVTLIRDNGRTIPAKLRRKIFGRFVRLGRELEREKSGTGLGLFIVSSLVRRMGGSVAVRPRKGTSGNIFEVQLPGQALRRPSGAAAEVKA